MLLSLIFSLLPVCNEIWSVSKLIFVSESPVWTMSSCTRRLVVAAPVDNTENVFALAVVSKNWSCPESFFILKSGFWFVSVNIICGATPETVTLFTKVPALVIVGEIFDPAIAALAFMSALRIAPFAIWLVLTHPLLIER